jgi:hypothetical protein
VKPEDIKNNLYTGESNIEYFLENRHHVKLPIPVYLSEYGGKVKVDILVDRSGKVIKAEPVIQIYTMNKFFRMPKLQLCAPYSTEVNLPPHNKRAILFTLS